VRSTYGFLAEPTDSTCTNAIRYLHDTPSWLYYNRPSNLRFHNLCTTAQIPPTMKSLLGLGLNFCLLPVFSTTPSILQQSIDRFRRDIYVKCFWSNKTNSSTPSLYLRSNWMPPLDKIPPKLQNRTDNFASSLSWRFRKRKCNVNLLPHQRAAFSYLRNKTDLIVLKTDKNLGPAIMERNLYLKTAHDEHLSNTTTYRQLTESQALGRVNVIKRKIEIFLKQYIFHSSFEMDRKYLQRYSDSVKDPFSYFYLLAKVHKKPWRTRPIVSVSGSISYGIGKWVDKQLQRICQLLPYTVKSSYELSLILRAIPPSSIDAKLFSMDAVSMYTNIDTAHAKEVITKFLQSTDYAQRANVNIPALLYGLSIVMEHNIFKFGTEFWIQQSGTAMGTPPAPCYATLYYAIHELKIIQKYPALKFYVRYLDDCLGVWLPCNDEEILSWENFQQDVNDFGILRWEFQPHCRKINFLDLEISYTVDNKLITRLFEKALNLYLYLPPHSAHSPGVLKGLIFGMIIRIKRLTSEQCEIIPTIRKFYHRLLQRGYDIKMLNPLFQTGLNLSTIHTNQTNITPPIQKKSDAIIFHLPYHPKDLTSKDIQQIAKKHLLSPSNDIPLCHILNHKNQTLDITRLIIAYSRQKNLGNYLAPRKILPLCVSPSTFNSDDPRDAFNPNPAL
jgi:hypothetical protein